MGNYTKLDELCINTISEYSLASTPMRQELIIFNVFRNISGTLSISPRPPKEV